MGIITQGIEKFTCRWDSTLNMVKYNHNMRSEVYSMKKLFKVFSLMLVVIMAFPFSVMASENDQQRSDLIGAEERNSTKSDAENHGVGLASVYRAVAKYHGSVVIEDSELGKFKIRIVLYSNVQE